MANNSFTTKKQLQDTANGVIAKVKAKGYASGTTVSTLVGSDTGKSVRTIANEELTAQLIPQAAKESLDTLAEIAAWIQNHPDDAAAMNEKLTLGTYDNNGTQTQYATVRAYVEAVMQAAELSGGNGVDITSNVVSLAVNSSAANGLSVGSSGLSLAVATADTYTGTQASGTYVSGTTYYTTQACTTEVDTSDFVAGETSVSSYYVLTKSANGNNGAMTAADKEKLSGITVATDAEVATMIAGLDSLD